MHGYWLELAVQQALRMARIPFAGSPMKIEHYPHSIGQHVDIETYYALFECTNPKDKTTWLNDTAMNEKIEYFLKADLNHKKKWFIILISTMA
jgi:hypothetical protein